MQYDFIFFTFYFINYQSTLDNLRNNNGWEKNRHLFNYIYLNCSVLFQYFSTYYFE